MAGLPPAPVMRTWQQQFPSLPLLVELIDVEVAAVAAADRTLT